MTRHDGRAVLASGQHAGKIGGRETSRGCSSAVAGRTVGLQSGENLGSKDGLIESAAWSEPAATTNKAHQGRGRFIQGSLHDCRLR